MLTDDVLRFFRSSHKNLGLALAVFLLLISITGILLNHSQVLGLAEQSVPALIASRYYTDDEVLGFEVEGHYFFVLGDNLYADDVEIAQCEALKGVVNLEYQLVILCDGELLLFMPDYKLIERIGVAFGLPENIEGISAHEGKLLLSRDEGIFSFDTDSLLAESVSGVEPVWPERKSVPDSFVLGESISWQQFVLDLHSGMFLGGFGKLFADLLAIFIIVMTISGLVMRRVAR